MNDVAKSMAIELIRFIRKSSDGPYASLKGSPTVSPTTVALGFLFRFLIGFLFPPHFMLDSLGVAQFQKDIYL